MERFKEDIQSMLDKTTKFWLMEQLRTKLKSIRKKKGLTQAEVAEKLGKDQVFVSNCESGRRRIDPIELLAFASAYKVELEEFIDELDLDEAAERNYRPGA